MIELIEARVHDFSDWNHEDKWKVYKDWMVGFLFSSLTMENNFPRKTGVLSTVAFCSLRNLYCYCKFNNGVIITLEL